MRERKRAHKRLYDEVVRILYRHDPIGIGVTMDGPSDEYGPEAGTILPRLSGIGTSQELAVILQQEFVRWFDEKLAGPVEEYLPIAAEILVAARGNPEAGTVSREDRG